MKQHLHLMCILACCLCMIWVYSARADRITRDLNHIRTASELRVFHISINTGAKGLLLRVRTNVWLCAVSVGIASYVLYCIYCIVLLHRVLLHIALLHIVL